MALDGDGGAIDPERLLLEEDGVEQLRGGGLGCERLGFATYHPSLFEQCDIEVHVRPRVLGAGRNIVNDETEVMWICSETNVIERAIGVVAGDEDRTAVEIARVFGSVAEGVDGPGGIVGIGTEIMDPRLIRRNRRGEFGLGLGKKDGRTA